MVYDRSSGTAAAESSAATEPVSTTEVERLVKLCNTMGSPGFLWNLIEGLEHLAGKPNQRLTIENSPKGYAVADQDIFKGT